MGSNKTLIIFELALYIFETYNKKYVRMCRSGFGMTLPEGFVPVHNIQVT